MLTNQTDLRPLNGTFKDEYQYCRQVISTTESPNYDCQAEADSQINCSARSKLDGTRLVIIYLVDRSGPSVSSFVLKCFCSGVGLIKSMFKNRKSSSAY
ncbi:hypothetical protein DID88_005748 [Monilinia fructigena]|uniref:Uncharacterized protein n=1 Tax=Monilinia fructigena TaxID=38457 RepID=A0A395J602_9HELO|nr:hypothetical protein DID88_005748 [Monilinia fructigena]